MRHECNIFVKVKKLPIAISAIQQAVSIVLDKVKRQKTAVSIHCIGLSAMRRMNMTYRGKDRPTDVLSFSITESDMPGDTQDDVGDIFVCIPYIEQQAQQVGVTFREELIRMITHGLLHLLGFDHMKEKDAERMFSLQESCVRQILKK